MNTSFIRMIDRKIDAEKLKEQKQEISKKYDATNIYFDCLNNLYNAIMSYHDTRKGLESIGLLDQTDENDGILKYREELQKVHQEYLRFYQENAGEFRTRNGREIYMGRLNGIYKEFKDKEDRLSKIWENTKAKSLKNDIMDTLMGIFVSEQTNFDSIHRKALSDKFRCAKAKDAAKAMQYLTEYKESCRKFIEHYIHDDEHITKFLTDFVISGKPLTLQDLDEDVWNWIKEYHLEGHIQLQWRQQ